MKVTIEGDLDQVSEALGLPTAPPAPRTQRIAENQARQKEFVARRKVVVDAFRLARSNGLGPEMAALLEAIRRTNGVTDDDIELACQVTTATLPNGER